MVTLSVISVTNFFKTFDSNYKYRGFVSLEEELSCTHLMPYSLNSASTPIIVFGPHDHPMRQILSQFSDVDTLGSRQWGRCPGSEVMPTFGCQSKCSSHSPLGVRGRIDAGVWHWSSPSGLSTESNLFPPSLDLANVMSLFWPLCSFVWCHSSHPFVPLVA